MARKGINGKQSGNSFEREWAKKLSLWITDNVRNDCVWRTSNSGGKATVTGSDTQCGDLHAVRPEAYPFFNLFSVELKNYKPINLLHFDRVNFKLYDWWAQATKDAKKANKIPLLIFNAKRIGQYFVLNSETFNFLNNNEYIKNTDKSSPHITLKPPGEIIKYSLLLSPAAQLFELLDIDRINTNGPSLWDFSTY